MLARLECENQMRNSCDQDQATDDKCDSKRDRQRKNDGQNSANKGHSKPTDSSAACIASFALTSAK
jgi:hypothetical protein